MQIIQFANSSTLSKDTSVFLCLFLNQRVLVIEVQ